MSGICDLCRVNKTSCDAGLGKSPVCTACLLRGTECAYDGSLIPADYIRNLESKLTRIESVLSQRLSEIDFTEALECYYASDVTKREAEPQSEECVCDTQVHARIDTTLRHLEGLNPEEQSKMMDFEDDLLISGFMLEDGFTGLKHSECLYGSSSLHRLVSDAVNTKSRRGLCRSDFRPSIRLKRRRSEEWSNELPSRNYLFPEPDLMYKLVGLYFRHVNSFYPLLHRPTFERSVSNGLHHEDDGFASTLLLVCANGARWSDDPNVLSDCSSSPYSRGFKWFQQVSLELKWKAIPTLYDVQVHFLAVAYLYTSSVVAACWPLIRLGISTAIELGAHRQNHQQPLTVYEEHLRRAFWCLFYFDMLLGTFHGRPFAVQFDDLDAVLPAECDDEYWEHPDPAQRFRQPVGQPCLVSFFVKSVKLMQIAAYATRTIYWPRAAKKLYGIDTKEWQEHFVTEMDSALNRWLESLPEHLKWDPDGDLGIFYDQSLLLNAYFYHTQILVHRLFLPTPKNPSPLRTPSLAICTRAARLCLQMVDVHRKRSPPGSCLIDSALPLANSNFVILLDIWARKLLGLTQDLDKQISLIHGAMDVLKDCEARWHAAGRGWDTLVQMAHILGIPLPDNAYPDPDCLTEASPFSVGPDGKLRNTDIRLVASCGVRVPPPSQNPSSQDSIANDAGFTSLSFQDPNSKFDVNAKDRNKGQEHEELSAGPFDDWFFIPEEETSGSLPGNPNPLHPRKISSEELENWDAFFSAFVEENNYSDGVAL